MEENQSTATVALRTIYDVKRVECVGLQFLKYLAETHPFDGGHLSHSSSEDKISDDDKFEVDVDYLRSLDPKEWKNQDHYAVLGLKDLRFDASEDDIRRAYRKIVLKHHPDKRKAQGEDVRQEDDYFTCITKAYETLGEKVKRRAFDSVDPEFDDILPSQSDIEKDFFGSLTDAFKTNARWSEKRHVPLLGDENSKRESVEKFYDFWYNFQSWREFSYMDEEEKDKGQDRDERRWIDKQNKAIRAKRKKEEMSRIRSLIDLAYNNDPRIVKFKREEKERKLALKRAKQDAYQAQKDAEERAVKEAALAKQKAAEAEQKRIEAIQKEKEKDKRALKKERKLLRDTAKSNDYYTTDDKEKLKHLEGVEKICESLKILELQDFNKNLQSEGREAFVKMLTSIEEKLEEERRALFQKSSIPNNQGLKIVNRKAMWNHENVQLLIKAVNLFPAGTISRWDVIANYLNQHGFELGDNKFYAKDTLNKAKELQSSDFSKNDLKEKVNEKAFESFEKSKKDLRVVDQADISVNLDDENENKKNSANVNENKKKKKEVPEEVKVNGHPIEEEAAPPPPTPTPVVVAAVVEKPKTTEKKEPKPWSKEEQALLEQALKTYPTTTADRWDKIAECIPNRTKKECMRRVKELVDLVNAKREAQQTVK